MYCSIEKCGRIAKTRGMCTVHYMRALENPGDMEVLHAPIREYKSGRSCSVDGCDKPHDANDLCQMHRRRLARSGSLELQPRMPKPKLPQQPCPVEGCEKPSKGSGMCSMHCTRMKRHGSLETPIARHPDPFVRFASRLEPAGDCWQWAGHASKDGYPYFVIAQALQVRAHRWALENIGEVEIPEGYEVDHICHNTLCCRPGHLQALTTDEHIELGRERRKMRAGTGLEWAGPSKHRSMREIYFGLEHKLPTALSFHP